MAKPAYRKKIFEESEMQGGNTAKVAKISKGIIQITFPPGTNANILEEVPLQALIDALEGRGSLANQSAFPLNAPVPV